MPWSGSDWKVTLNVPFASWKMVFYMLLFGSLLQTKHFQSLGPFSVGRTFGPLSPLPAVYLRVLCPEDTESHL